MNAVEMVEKTQLVNRPEMRSGDTVRVHVKVREGDKERIQVFEGMVIGMHRGGARVVHGAQGVVRSGRRAHLSAPLADCRQSGSHSQRQGAPREAVLPARPARQGCPHEGKAPDSVVGRRAR